MSTTNDPLPCDDAFLSLVLGPAQPASCGREWRFAPIGYFGGMTHARVIDGDGDYAILELHTCDPGVDPQWHHGFGIEIRDRGHFRELVKALGLLVKESEASE